MEPAIHDLPLQDDRRTRRAATLQMARSIDEVMAELAPLADDVGLCRIAYLMSEIRREAKFTLHHGQMN